MIRGQEIAEYLLKGFGAAIAGASLLDGGREMKRAKKGVGHVITRGLWIASGVSAGAALMYILDPNSGRRRRSKIQGQIWRAYRQQKTIMKKGARDLEHRVEGAVSRVQHVLFEECVPDVVLVERVRAAMGHCMTHPKRIQVQAQEGRITLSGKVLAKEEHELLERLHHVRGVREVENGLRPYSGAEIDENEGGSGSLVSRWVLMRESWSPAVRLLVNSSALGLSLYGLRGRSLLGKGLAAAGGVLMLRSLTNVPLGQLFGIGKLPHAVKLQKTLTVHAPIDKVFEFWSHFENFPKFMKHVHEVRIQGERRSHWRVEGPGRLAISWEAEITRYEPNRVLAWQTLAGSHVEHQGLVQFKGVNGDSTQLQIQMSYHPPIGAMGHVFAKLLRADPKHRMDQDLIRMKSLLEKGSTRVNGEKIVLHPTQLTPNTEKEVRNEG
jgi:uncharacterized membrane protein